MAIMFICVCWLPNKRHLIILISIVLLRRSISYFISKICKLVWCLWYLTWIGGKKLFLMKSHQVWQVEKENFKICINFSYTANIHPVAYAYTMTKIPVICLPKIFHLGNNIFDAVGNVMQQFKNPSAEWY